MKISNKLKFILPITFIVLFMAVTFFSFYQLTTVPASSSSIIQWDNGNSDSLESTDNQKKKYIKWFEFNVTYDVLDKTSKLYINSHVKNEDVKYNWIELISYLACKYGNDFSRFKQKDLDTLVEKLKGGQSMADITKNMKNYAYYFEGYDAVLHEFIGAYELQSNVNNTNYEAKYGIKAFHPVARNYSYSHYDDFGASRSYGYKRLHFGNDLMGSIGTPIIAVESGVVEAAGWNQYGGWRIGIRSFDKKRYYYYAHLRKNHPYPVRIKGRSNCKSRRCYRIFRYDGI